MQAEPAKPFLHHIYDKVRGWIRREAKIKPNVRIQAKVDIESYLQLGVRVPNVQINTASGPCCADTGASICLAGESFMRSLGLSREHLTFDTL